MAAPWSHSRPSRFRSGQITGQRLGSCVRIDHRRRPSWRTLDGDFWKRALRALIVPERNRFQARATRRRWFASKPLKTVDFKAFGDGQLQPTPRVITSGGSGTKGLWRDDGPCPPAGGAGQKTRTKNGGFLDYRELVR